MATTSELFRIVGNETRRSMLHLLSQEPHYILQLSKRLNITQPAILKHLHILEKAGLIESFRRKSGRGAARKYFKICNTVDLKLFVGPEDFKVTKAPAGEKCSKYLTAKERVDRLTDGINKSGDIQTKAAHASDLIKEVDGLISCDQYSVDRDECRECRRTASLKRKTAQIILSVSKGDLNKGVNMLAEILGL